MTGAFKVTSDVWRRGLKLHYKSYHSDEVTGFSNLVADTDEDTGDEDDSVESFVSDANSDGVKAVENLPKGNPEDAMKQDDSGDSNVGDNCSLLDGHFWALWALLSTFVT